MVCSDRYADVLLPKLNGMKKLRNHFEVSEWPLVLLTLLIALMLNQLV